jgi:uncharacterized protein
MGSGEGTVCDLGFRTVLTSEQRSRFQNPDVIRRIIAHPGVAAVVGLSSDPQKASYFVAAYLQKRGWKIVPVTPKKGLILGEESVPSLADIAITVDVVDVFRPSSEMPALARQAAAIRAKSFWMQLKLANILAAEIAEEAGLFVVADKCMKMEYGRYNGGLHSAGMDTGIISARRTPTTK